MWQTCLTFTRQEYLIAINCAILLRNDVRGRCDVTHRVSGPTARRKVMSWGMFFDAFDSYTLWITCVLLQRGYLHICYILYFTFKVIKLTCHWNI